MNFNCPQCGRSLTAGDAGFQGKCPGCGQPVSVTAADLTVEPAPDRVYVQIGQQASYAGWVILACAVAAGLLIGLLVLSVWLFYDPDRIHKAACETHLRSIATALDMYHQDYGSFPPAWVADAQGRPMHSWRVLILPALGEDDLYKEYKLDEPWDGPNNRQLAHRIPEVYCCPSDPSGYEGQTSYVALVGPQACWLGTKPVKLSQLAQPGQAIQVIEAYETGINWLEPRDFSAPAVAATINSSAGQGIRSLHPGGAHVLFADGQVEFLSDATSTSRLSQLFNAARISTAVEASTSKKSKEDSHLKSPSTRAGSRATRTSRRR